MLRAFGPVSPTVSGCQVRAKRAETCHSSASGSATGASGPSNSGAGSSVSFSPRRPNGRNRSSGRGRGAAVVGGSVRRQRRRRRHDRPRGQPVGGQLVDGPRVGGQRAFGQRVAGRGRVRELARDAVEERHVRELGRRRAGVEHRGRVVRVGRLARGGVGRRSEGPQQRRRRDREGPGGAEQRSAAGGGRQGRGRSSVIGGPHPARTGAGGGRGVTGAGEPRVLGRPAAGGQREVAPAGADFPSPPNELTPDAGSGSVAARPSVRRPAAVPSAPAAASTAIAGTTAPRIRAFDQ